MFETLCFSDDSRDFEGFLMISIGNYLAKVCRLPKKSYSNGVWALALILGVQMKMIMLIQHTEKKGNFYEIWNE